MAAAEWLADDFATELSGAPGEPRYQELKVKLVALIEAGDAMRKDYIYEHGPLQDAWDLSRKALEPGAG